jgi:uncharacterized RDD family membrane protein YckC
MDDTSRNPSPTPSILGLDNVRLDLPVASIGNRVLAAFLDHAVLAFLLLLVGGLTLFAIAASEIGRLIAFTIWLLIMFTINWGYFAISEIVLGGQTIGKRALKIRVVTQEGGAPSVPALLIRNFMRLIDNLIGIVLIAVDPRARRLGDLFAGTLVVHERVHHEELALSRIPSGWGAREVAMVESFLVRLPTLEPERRRHLGQRIIALVERDDPQFLDGIERHEDPSVTVRLAFRPERL